MNVYFDLKQTTSIDSLVSVQAVFGNYCLAAPLKEAFPC